jgi:hypothetical protein
VLAALPAIGLTTHALCVDPNPVAWVTVFTAFQKDRHHPI